MTGKPIIELQGVSKRFSKPLDVAAKLANMLGAGMKEEVVRAVRELKQQQERDFDLALPLERLPAAQVDCRLAQGVLLNVEDDDGAVEVVPNPIFASPDLSKLH